MAGGGGYSNWGGAPEFTLFFFGRTTDHPAQYTKKISDQQYAAQRHQCDGYPAVTLVLLVFQGNTDSCGAKIKDMSCED